MITTPAVADDAIPDIGSPHSKYLSPQQEAEIGRQMMLKIKESAALITDPEIQAYIQSLGNKLVNASDHNNLPKFTFFIIASDQINAFAAPGGYIGLFTGLISASRSESELASVIAHEIGHITQSHLARRIAENERLSIPRIAALLASVLIATQDPQAGSAALISTNAANIQHQLAYSRTAEKEADNVGLKILTAAGYDPKGITDFFKTLQNAHAHSGKTIEYLSTHPLTDSRIAELNSRINHKYTWMGNDSTNYTLIKTKLNVNSFSDPSKALAKYTDLLRKNYSISNRYGYALAKIKTRNYSQAEKAILEIINDDAERVAYLIALGQSQLKQNKYTACFKTYEKALSIYPDNFPIIHHYLVALLYSGSYTKGLDFFQKKQELAKKHPELYKLAGDLAAKSKKPWLAYEFMGDYYKNNYHQSVLAREHYKKAIAEVKSRKAIISNQKVIIARVEAKIDKIVAQRLKQKKQ